MSPTSRTAAAMTARNPEDLLAVAPVLLGFWPEESIVMMTFGADRPFHARVDLPPVAEQTFVVRRELEEALMEPARRLRTRAVVLLYFTADPAAAAAVHRILRRACNQAHIDVVVALQADGERYTQFFSQTSGLHTRAMPYDVSAHPFVAEAVVNGRLVHRSRAELAASFDPDEVAVARVRAALERSGLDTDDVPDDGRSLRVHGRWVESLVAGLVSTGQDPSDDEVARLVWAMQAIRVRDAAWSLIRAGNALAQVRFWSALVTRVPEDLVAAPAAVLGWAAWQAGDGARAWMAIDRCQRSDPDYGLASHLAELLQGAVSPDFWEGGFDWALGLPQLHD